MALDDVLGGGAGASRRQRRAALRRAHEHELQGDDAGGAYVVRISGKDTGLLAIDRENEVHNTSAAAETGVGAPFVAALPEHDALVLEFIEGEVMDAEKLRARRPARGGRGCVPAAARGAAVPRRLRHVRDPARLHRRRAGARLPAARAVPRVRAAGARARGGDARAREPTVPCNNDLLAENFIDVDGAMRLIDYEYSGTTSRPSSSGTSGASRTSRSRSSRSSSRTTTAGRCATRSRARGSGG